MIDGTNTRPEPFLRSVTDALLAELQDVATALRALGVEKKPAGMAGEWSGYSKAIEAVEAYLKLAGGARHPAPSCA